MNSAIVENVANAVLYEGYILYPYRSSAVKNRQRFNFGGLYPPAYCEAQVGADSATMQTECLVLATEKTRLNVRVRFLQLLAREIQRPVPNGSEPAIEVVDSIEVDGQLYQTWQEAVERDVTVADVGLIDIANMPFCQTFGYLATRKCEPLTSGSGELMATICRRQETIAGCLEVSAQEVEASLYRVRVTIKNETPLFDAESMSRDAVLLQSLASCHTILDANRGEFISLLDPADEYREHAAGCRNVGTWPVLVGEEGQRGTLLSSPIILYDYPQIAAESPGTLYDGLEIDEILTLRIQSLTDDEKRQMRSVDARARELLERTESLPSNQLLKLHGTMRRPSPSSEVSP